MIQSWFTSRYARFGESKESVKNNNNKYGTEHSLMSPMNQPPHMESRASSGSHNEKSCKKATALILTKKIQVRNQYQVAPLASITRLEDLLVPGYEDLLDHTFRIIQPSECVM